MKPGSLVRRIVDEIRASAACAYLLCEHRGKLPKRELSNRDYERVTQAVRPEVEDAVRRMLPLVGAAAAVGAARTMERLAERGLVDLGQVPVELGHELVNLAAGDVLDGTACVAQHIVHPQPEATQ